MKLMKNIETMLINQNMPFNQYNPYNMMQQNTPYTNPLDYSQYQMNNFKLNNFPKPLN